MPDVDRGDARRSATEALPAGAPTTTKTSAGPRFAGFDGLRAIAALAVVGTHVAFPTRLNVTSDFWGPYTARLDVGVAIFFLISGFLLYRPFVAARFDERRSPEIGPYFWKRFLRIYPAFWVAFTLVVFVLPRPAGADAIPSLGGLVAHYSLTHIYFQDHVLGPLSQSWTLATEVSFYLFLPLYAWALRRWRARTPEARLVRELVGVAALYGISVAFRLAVDASGTELAGMYKTWLVARTDLFALGMVLAIASAWLASRGRPTPRLLAHPAAPWVSWGLALVAFHMVTKEIGLEVVDRRGPIIFDPDQELALQALYGVIGFFLLVPVVFSPAADRRPGAIRHFLVARPMIWLGFISYGIYLYHVAAIDLFLVIFDEVVFVTLGPSQFGWIYPFGIEPAFVEVLVFVLAVTIPLAAGSYYLVERPTSRWKNRVPFRHSTRAGARTS